MGRLRFFTLCCMALLALAPLCARPPRRVKPWDALEARKATIGKIEVEVVDVFDLTKPSENTWLGRSADKLHASTKEVVVRRVLLFKEGDPVRARLIYETERLLRALPFLKDARISPVTGPDGIVVAKVQVRDAWTTQVNAGFSSVGGQKAGNFGLDEVNFLGEGKGVAFDYSKNFQRSTMGLTYSDPQFLGSHWALMLQDQVLSDGMARAFSLGQPFYALDTPWSTAVAMSMKRTSLYLYDKGVQIYQAPFIQNDAQWTGALAFHKAGDRVWRAGVMLDRQDTQYGLITLTGPTAPPDPLLAPTLTNRRLRGAGVTLATQEDAYEVFTDLLGMDTPEDNNLAWNGNLQLGVYSRSLGSTKTEPFFLFSGTDAWSASENDLTLLSVNLSGRAPASGLENGQMNLALIHYWKVTPNQIFASIASADLGCRLDPENWYYVGGDQGLRGFPNEMHPGEARWLVSADYRMLTQQRWWGLVRLGYDAFVDTGAVRQMDGLGWSRRYADAGVGLRLGNLKSSLGRVISLSVAFPINREPYQSRFQFTVGNAMRF